MLGRVLSRQMKYIFEISLQTDLRTQRSLSVLSKTHFYPDVSHIHVQVPNCGGSSPGCWFNIYLVVQQGRRNDETQHSHTEPQNTDADTQTHTDTHRLPPSASRNPLLIYTQQACFDGNLFSIGEMVAACVSISTDNVPFLTLVCALYPVRVWHQRLFLSNSEPI